MIKALQTYGFLMHLRVGDCTDSEFRFKQVDQRSAELARLQRSSWGRSPDASRRWLPRGSLGRAQPLMKDGMRRRAWSFSSCLSRDFHPDCRAVGVGATSFIVHKNSGDVDLRRPG
jgi:hypothetical protein